MQETDWELILACRQGDSQAWGRLINKYERLVYSIPLNYGLTGEDAADISQATFTILIQSLDALYEETRLAAWLVTVARRRTWRMIARRQREQPSEEAALDDGDLRLLDGASQRAIQQWEQWEWLQEGLAQLDSRCRDLLLALYFDPQQPSYAEIADRFDLPVGSIGPTRARCLQRLKQLLGPK